MQNVSITRIVASVASAIVAVVFLIAAVPKIVDPSSFAQSIENYRLIQGEWIGALALWIPWVEVLAALGLMTGFARKGAAILSAGLLFIFCIAIGWVISQGIDIECGCFGAEAESKANGWSLVRNVGLIVLCSIVLIFDRSSSSEKK